MENPIVEGLAQAEVICDSVHKGSRLVTVEVEFPRPYLAEFNTHTRFSRNSASSRAIPVWKRILSVLERPYIPDSFGTNKAGMQAGEVLSERDQHNAAKNWRVGRDIAVVQAYFLAGGREEFLSVAKKGDKAEDIEKLIDTIENLAFHYQIFVHLSRQDKGMHKQHANRVLEPYAFHTVVVTATHWRNFFGLRASGNAQPEAQDFGIAIAKAIMASKPSELSKGQWHLPYIREEDMDEMLDESSLESLAEASAGKCARVSYLTQDGVRSLDKDIELAKNLQRSGHMSPFQHVARPKEEGDPANSHGNYSPVWTQFRKLLGSENDFTMLVPKEELVLGCRGDEALADFILSYPE
jgi:hypothetical protein